MTRAHVVAPMNGEASSELLAEDIAEDEGNVVGLLVSSFRTAVTFGSVIGSRRCLSLEITVELRILGKRDQSTCASDGGDFVGMARRSTVDRMAQVSRANTPCHFFPQ